MRNTWQIVRRPDNLSGADAVRPWLKKKCYEIYKTFKKENGHISIMLHPAHTVTLGNKAAACCSFLGDHMESESYKKHTARWPRMATVGLSILQTISTAYPVRGHWSEAGAYLSIFG